METRKIQLAGGTTYTVSLPKEWASEHGLEAGASVRVYPHADGSLEVRTNGRGPEDDEPLTVDADSLSTATLRRRVGAGYRSGRDAVELTSEAGFDAEQRRTVRSAAQDLLGVDVVSESDSRIVCRSLLDVADVSVEQTLRQLRFVACSTHRDAVEAVLGENQDGADLADRAADATRLRSLVVRQFERALVDPGVLDDLAVTRTTLFDYSVTARELERVATHAATLADAAGRDELTDADLPDTFRERARRSRDLVERAATELVDGADADRTCDVLADCDALSELLLDGSTDAPGGSPTLATHCLVCTVECARSIADVALRAASRPDRR